MSDELKNFENKKKYDDEKNMDGNDVTHNCTLVADTDFEM